MEDINQAIQAITDPSSSSSPLETRPSGEEDPAAMTIEFLRARLLSERSVSKAARERAQQLAKKVSELEERLEVEIQFRKKLEADRLEILLKYRAELSEEYGDFFASSDREGFPRDESVPDSPNSRKHDISEGFESYTPNQDEEGLPNSRLEQLERSDSSQQLSREEGNDEDDETDHSGQEKGVLSWGRRKGSRKEFGYGTDWPGRSLSQRSLTSVDGESPQKKWAGKSVRQIRKRESRSHDTNERENGQTQACEELNGKIGQRSGTRVPLPCDDERDTEVERVLEQQAELIEQYAAEENAQRAWEAKFKKGKALSGYENVIMPSDSGGKLPATTSTLSDEKERLVKDDAAIGGTLPNQSLNEGATRHSSKVHPEAIANKLEGTQEQLEFIHKSTSEDIDVPNAAFEDDAAGSSGDQSRVGISDEEPFRDEKSMEGTRTHEGLNEDVSHGQMPSNMAPEQSEQSIDSSVEGRRSKYKPHLSSSFRFAVFPDVEPVAGSSPQMHGFTTYKHDAHGGGELNESRGASEQVSASGICDAHRYDSHDCASADNQIGANDTPPKGDRSIGSEDDEFGKSGKDMLQEEMLGREKLPSHSMGVVMSSNPSMNLITSSHSSKEEVDRKMKGLGGDQDLQPGLSRQSSDSPSHMEPRGPSSGEYLQRRYLNFPSHPDHGLQLSKDFDGANFDNLALYPSIRSGMHGSGLPAPPYEETVLRSHQRSLDAFTRVADVLRALEIAKLQVQTSNEQDDPFVGDMMDYDGRDAYYAEPPRLPSMYAAPPQPYASSLPYSSRGPATPYMHGWGDYGAASSRQVANASYMHYPPRMPETQNMWHPPPPPPPPPPPLPPLAHGFHNSTLYQYDTRQHR